MSDRSAAKLTLDSVDNVERRVPQSVDYYYDDEDDDDLQSNEHFYVKWSTPTSIIMRRSCSSKNSLLQVSIFIIIIMIYFEVDAILDVLSMSPYKTFKQQIPTDAAIDLTIRQ
jgi:hypothetical protein